VEYYKAKAADPAYASRKKIYVKMICKLSGQCTAAGVISAANAVAVTPKRTPGRPLSQLPAFWVKQSLKGKQVFYDSRFEDVWFTAPPRTGGLPAMEAYLNKLSKASKAKASDAAAADADADADGDYLADAAAADADAADAADAVDAAAATADGDHLSSDDIAALLAPDHEDMVAVEEVAPLALVAPLAGALVLAEAMVPEEALEAPAAASPATRKRSASGSAKPAATRSTRIKR
jgi:hypothetical protein